MSNNRFEFSGREGSGARLLYISRSLFGGDWHSTLHTHACAELFYCERGIGRFVLDGQEVTVGGDDMVLVNAMVEHTELSNRTNPLEYIVLGIDGLQFDFGDAPSTYTVFNVREHRSEILPLVQMMLHEAQEQLPQYEVVCQHFLDAMIIFLARQEHGVVLVEPQRRGSSECAAARRYIDEHFAEPLTLDMLAAEVHLNKYYLVHAFNKEYATTPINYLLERRVHESKYLLSNTNHSLSQISHLLGFSSPSYFSQSFRRIAGMSPMEYRRSSGEKVQGAQPGAEAPPSQ